LTFRTPLFLLQFQKKTLFTSELHDCRGDVIFVLETQ
jgi:hypothetical protein